MHQQQLRRNILICCAPPPAPWLHLPVPLAGVCQFSSTLFSCRTPPPSTQHTAHSVVTMPAAGSRRVRHPCGAVIMACSVLAAVAPCVVGFQVAAPPRSCSSNTERGVSGLRVAGRIHQARQRAPAGSPLCEEGDRCLRRPRASALLSEREDGGDEGGQEQQVSVSV